MSCEGPCRDEAGPSPKAGGGEGFVILGYENKIDLTWRTFAWKSILNLKTQPDLDLILILIYVGLFF